MSALLIRENYYLHTGHPRTRGFSLVELLAVIAIITAMMTGLIHVLSDPDKSRRQSAREIVRAWLQTTRSHAIAQGRPTALLIPSFSAESSHGGRWLSIAELEPQTDPERPFRVIRMIRRWTELPDHVFLLDQQAAGLPHPTLLDSAPLTAATHQNHNIICYTLVFAPDGRIIHPTGGSRLTLALGQARAAAPGRVAVIRTRDGQRQLDCLRIDRLLARARLIHPDLES